MSTAHDTGTYSPRNGTGRVPQAGEADRGP